MHTEKLLSGAKICFSLGMEGFTIWQWMKGKYGRNTLFFPLAFFMQLSQSNICMLSASPIRMDSYLSINHFRTNWVHASLSLISWKAVNHNFRINVGYSLRKIIHHRPMLALQEAVASVSLNTGNLENTPGHTCNAEPWGKPGLGLKS